ncbi:MAG: Planctomycete cytochrome, partial [Bacteroidetes bacterium]|nr:Planctomycete cytochrome [Bacteroidota bacterium]
MKVKILLFVLVVILSSGCKEQGSIVPPSGEFTTTVKPILDRSCGGPDCHGGGPRGFAAALDLTSYDGIFRGSKNGAVVISGNPYMSPLVQTINQTDTTLSPLSSARMPLSRDPLPNSDIQAIVQWIRDGARNEDGSLPFPEPRPLGKVFFTSQFVDLAGVIDISTGLIMRYVKVGNSLPLNTPPQSPHNVQVDDQGLYYYVTLIRGKKLRKYDAATNELLGEVPVGVLPAHVVITP